MSNKSFVYCLEHIQSYRWNFASIKVGIETRHLKLSNYIRRPKNSSKQERMTCLKSGLKSTKNMQKIEDSGYMDEF
jgi:hypothetical protein